MITICHNPRCSKSRETLALVQQVSSQKNLQLVVVDYQKSPLDEAQLRLLQQQLGIPVRAMLRTNEVPYGELKLAVADDQTVFAALASHPVLLQRPVVIYQGKAMIARPPEQVLSLFQEDIKVTS
jgi:arsenate reductase